MPPLQSAGPFPEAEHPEYAGQYPLEDCLGTGGMGVVHLATSASGLRLAVKVIHAEHASDPEFRARFRQEVAAARRVSGAFTAPVVDADPEAGRPWMATLFIDGPTLAERVKRNGPLAPAELQRVGAGLAEALRDIHRAGVVHRDLKPSNVLLAQDGPKVIDFGISRPTDSDLRTETGKLIGTPPFMAPEQFQRPREVGPEADVFALGAVLVHAATGRGPFDSDSPYIVAYQVVHNEPDLAGVPEGLVPLLRRCLAKEPQERPTPYELMVALRASSPSAASDTQAYIPAQRSPAAPAGEDAVPEPGAGDTEERGADGTRRRPRGPSGAAWWRRRPVVLWAALAVVLGSAGAAGAAFVGAPDEVPPRRPAAAPEPFRPWSTTLGGAAADGRAPACTTAGTALYCSGAGVGVARLDPAGGAVLWSAGAGPDGTRAGPGDEGAAPVAAGGVLQVLPPGGTRYRALDPASGTVRWERDVSAYATVRQAGGLVLLVSAEGAVRAVDAATGADRWSGRHGGAGTEWTGTPDGTGPVFATTPSADGTSTRVTAVGPADGRVLWTERLKGSLTPVAAGDGALHLLATDAEGFTDAVVRLDTAAPGHPSRRVGLTAPLDQAQAAVAGDVVYVVGAGGSLLAVDTARSAGAERWRLETAVAHLSRPAPRGGHVYLSAGDGRLLAVDAGRGRLVGQTKPRMGGGRHASVLPAPVTAPGRVYATAPDGSVFAVDARNPSRW
ncbi:protein kinase domain-containing protein [Streptomyces sp. t39]|uniref:serine/threonine-protein kinase n=1 Tax=Streptomyces sp. t39 TaxID=1828156 RepID=UPI0011CDE4E9|nr:serine/threonine-protein kinase [Streptomyces sp. t39]TXS57814.1 serine/threonine protein kinase [Streptomyces sp. t39]